MPGEQVKESEMSCVHCKRIDCNGEHGGITAELTERERQVLTLVAQSRSLKQMANDLHLSTHTIDTHKCSLYKKLGLRDIAATTRYAIRHGYVSADFEPERTST
jgi:DNA-binding NarL/FixJ family response regulator